MIKQYGTDAFRFTLTAFAAQGREIRIDKEHIDGCRRSINKLWNAARFAQMESGPEIVAAAERPAELALPHCWILSRISGATAAVRKALDGYNFNEIASAIYQNLRGTSSATGTWSGLRLICSAMTLSSAIKPEVCCSACWSAFSNCYIQSAPLLLRKFGANCQASAAR